MIICQNSSPIGYSALAMVEIGRIYLLLGVMHDRKHPTYQQNKTNVFAIPLIISKIMNESCIEHDCVFKFFFV